MIWALGLVAVCLSLLFIMGVEFTFRDVSLVGWFGFGLWVLFIAFGCFVGLVCGLLLDFVCWVF